MAVLLHTAPLLGIPIWLWELNLPSNGWNFPLLFAAGLFMLAAGLLIPGAAWVFVRRDFVRINAVSALRFQSVIALVVLVLAIAFAIAVQLDQPNPTLDHPPIYSTGILFVSAIVGGFVLPVVELIRACAFGVRAWRNS